MPQLGAVCGDRDNNFNLIRMAAALAVVVSHAWPAALGAGAIEPLQEALGLSLGTVALHVFFAVSGFLVAGSFLRSRGLADWLAGRALRLVPALAAVVLGSALLLGPLAGRLPLSTYLADPGVPAYVLRNLTLVSPQWPLPGVFETVPYGPVVNGPLWSLFHEVTCYAGLLLAGSLGALAAGWRAGLALGLWAGLAVAAAPLGLTEAVPRLGPLIALSVPFAIGAALFVWRKRVVLHPLAGAGLAASALAAQGSPLFVPLLDLALAYNVLLLAYLPGGGMRSYNRLGDYSYGLYLVHFPVQQLVMQLAAPEDPLRLLLLSLPPALLLAVLSWHLLEKPALAARPRVAGLIGRRALAPGLQ